MTPGTQSALGNVRITITEGPDSGTVVTTDASGQFRFRRSRRRAVALEATRDGFQLWRMTKTLMIDGDKQIEVMMYPTPPKNANGETATAAARTRPGRGPRRFPTPARITAGWRDGVCPGPMCGAPIKPR